MGDEKRLPTGEKGRPKCIPQVNYTLSRRCGGLPVTAVISLSSRIAAPAKPKDIGEIAPMFTKVNVYCQGIGNTSLFD
jgi:hypothetical protein